MATHDRPPEQDPRRGGAATRALRAAVVRKLKTLVAAKLTGGLSLAGKSDVGRMVLIAGACIAVFAVLAGVALLMMLMQSRAASDSAGGSGAACGGTGTVVGATVFGGPGDPTTPDDVGAGGKLTGRDAYAELSRDAGAKDFSALTSVLSYKGETDEFGGLPMKTKLRISAGGHEVVAQKLDRGAGGGPIGSRPRALDLWWQTADKLKLGGSKGTWSGLVRVELVGGDTGGSDSASDCKLVSASGLRKKIVETARTQIGVRELPINRVLYNNNDGQPWCAAFVSWVWEKADVPNMRFDECTATFYQWARSYGGALPETATPKPGDAIFYGSGPEHCGPGGSVHMGIVETVSRVGDAIKITTIEGNTAGGVQVARIGPFDPMKATSEGGRPGPVYGYARPPSADASPSNPAA
jgi:CHAP domain